MRSKVLAATILGSVLVFLDGTIVNVLLPALRREFSLSLGQAQWVTQAYLLFLSALLLLGGSLGDHLGRKRIYQIGILVFTASSFACALAPNFGFLIAARALQGVGGALLTPGSLAIINAVFPKEDRGKAIGTWASFTTLASAAGPVVGGLLVDHFSWRWAFAFNLPYAVASWHLTRVAVPESCSEQHSAPLDFLGAGLASLSFFGMTLGLMQGSAPIGLVSILLFAVFLSHERRAKAPMIPLELFRGRTFSAVNLLTFFVYGALGIVFFMLPFQLIEVGGFSAWQAGAAGFPFIAAVFAMSRVAGALLDRCGPLLPLTTGPLIAGGGMILLRKMAVPHASYAEAYLFPMLIFGIGMALTITPLTTTVMAAAGESYSGVASGINNAVARLSALLAIAALPIFVTQVYGIPFRVDLECYRAALSFAAGLAFVGAVCGGFSRRDVK